MEAMGGSVLSTTLQVVFDRIALNENFLLGLFPGNKKLQLKRLMRVLQIVSEVLQDAENKEVNSPAVKSWFNSLKHVVYQADDVLDEINISLKHSKSHLSDTDFTDQFIGELSPRLEEICDALERKVQQIGMLLYGKQQREDRAPSTSVVEQSQTRGRDDEKEEIIQMVLSGEGGTDISVIRITGMGGIGKTTLAQLVYNDERVKNHFKTRAWACVSEEFDVYRVTKDLLMQVNSSLVDEKDDLNQLQVKLKENLEQKRFIIILDDIWNDNFNDYQRLMKPLKSGSRGSKIIVTTRNENIALMLHNEPFLHLNPISDNQSWSLFELHAFDNRARLLSDEFVTIGKTMAKKCKGLPLAIITVAGALRSKKDISEWRDISSNDDWMADGDILPALRLSYKLLPSHLKCCFALCAVFPKNAPFDKKETALLWMANDLVPTSSQKVAENYFEELRARSFFEMENDNKYVMHDLINDLARHVSGSFCARMEDCQFKGVHQGIQVKYDLPPEVLHCSYLSSNVNTLTRLRGLAQARGLRTFLFNVRSPYGYDLGDITKIFLTDILPKPYDLGDITKIFLTDILPKLRHIRALSLHRYIEVIPDSIGDLKHLRLLNLSKNFYIRKLPNNITKCLNLQTLILAGCSKLEKLPKDTRLLINLQNLILEGCSELKELPKDMVCLTNLQTLILEGCSELEELPKDMVRLINLQTLILADCRNLEELPEDMGLLTNLQHLDVRGVGFNVLAEMGIWLSQMKDIQNLSIVVNHIHGSALEQLDKLQLGQFLKISELGNGVTVEMARNAQLKNKNYIEKLTLNWSSSSEDDWKILAELRPHTNIRELEISGYRGTAFPNWVGDSSFCNLEELTLLYCKNCIHLPPLGQLTGLKKIKISGMDGISEIGEMFYGSSSISKRFSKLKELEINLCLKLRSLPEEMHTQLPALCKLEISLCPEMECFPNGGLPPSLETLKIKQCKKLVKFPRNWGLQRLPSLIHLTIQGIEDKLFPEEGLLPATLRQLEIQDCIYLEALNHKGFQDITSLQYLSIEWCQKLRCLPEDGLPSSLSTLWIEHCPKLEGRLKREKGEDWPKIESIPEIYVDQVQI